MAGVPNSNQPVVGPTRLVTQSWLAFFNNLASGAVGSVVNTFNGRFGTVVLEASDITTALGFTPGQGTVTNVSSANSDLSVATGSTTPVLTVNSAPKWDTARTLSFTGDATGSGSVDGSANVATALTLATVNSNVGSFTSTNITVNAKGLITAASNGSGGGWTVYTTVLNDTTHTFSGLSGGNDLEIEVMGSSDQTANQTVNVTVNAVVTGYSVQRMYATGSSAPAADFVSGQAAWNNFGQMVGTGGSPSPPTTIWIKIFDYTNTAFNKAGIFHSRQGQSGPTEYVITGSMVVLGVSSSAITSVTIAMAAGHFATGTILKVRTV